jgi:hypothetical protein
MPKLKDPNLLMLLESLPQHFRFWTMIVHLVFKEVGVVCGSERGVMFAESDSRIDFS